MATSHFIGLIDEYKSGISHGYGRWLCQGKSAQRNLAPG